VLSVIELREREATALFYITEERDGLSYSHLKRGEKNSPNPGDLSGKTNGTEGAQTKGIGRWGDKISSVGPLLEPPKEGMSKRPTLDRGP